MPNTDAVLDDGTMSAVRDAVFTDQHCVSSATKQVTAMAAGREGIAPTSAPIGARQPTPINTARRALTDERPRRMRKSDSAPPPTLPKSAKTKGIQPYSPISERLNPRTR